MYQHSQKNKHYSDYKKNPHDSDLLKKANNARELRDIGLITGSILLGSGIAVHILF